jgi:hypothetical protein
MKRLWIVASLLLASTYGNAALVVQSRQCQDWADYQTVNKCSFHSPTTGGNAVIVFALGATGVTTIAVSDDRNHNYHVDLDYFFAGAGQRIVFASVASAQLVQTITLTMNTKSHYQAVLLEVSGLAGGAVRDRIATNDNGYHGDCLRGFGFTSGTTPTTSQAAEFLVGWTEQAYPNVMTFKDEEPWLLLEEEPLGGSRISYRQTTSVGTFAFTGALSGKGECRVGAAVVTYRQAESL